MTEIQGTALDAGGTAVPFADVRIALVTSSSGTPGYTAGGEILQALQVSANQAGAWSANLIPNSTITPANTYYIVTEGRGAVSDIVVPATGGPYQLSEVLVTPPPTPDAPGITGIQVAADGTVEGVRPEINLIAGTNVTVTAADNPSANRVDVTLTATGGGGGDTPSDTVQAATSFDLASAPGVATAYSRGDHTHGTPTAPTAASVGADPTGSAASAQAAAEANAAATYLPLTGGTMSGALAMGGNRVTGGAAGIAGTDLATVSQLPASLPPSGAAGGDLGSTYPNPTVTGTHLAAPLPLAQGGTGQATQQAALTALAGTQTAGRYLRSDGTNTSLAAIQAVDVPTLNQSTTGTAAGLSSTLAIGSGGTGQVTAQAAINALTGAQSAGKVLRSDGTNATLASIQVADVPTLNQSTTGTAANVTGTVALANGGTGQTSRQSAINALTGTQSAGTFLRSDGTNATLTTIQAADVPVLNQNTTGTAGGLSATLAIGSGGTGATTAIGARASLGEYTWDTPAARGLLEYNYPPQLATISNNLVSGSIYGSSFVAQGNSVVAKVGVGLLSSAGTPTAGQNLIGLYSISGTTATQIAVTGDLGTWSSQGFQSYAFGAGVTLTAGATYLILLISNATTPAHLAGLSTTAGFPPMYNAGLSNTSAPWLKVFLYGTAQTTLPSSYTISGTTMASTNSQFPWVCLL